MSEKNSDFKVTKLTKLRKTAGKEYQEAMLNRVEYFASKNAEKSIFNNIFENVLVKGISKVLDIKVKVDEMLGDNKEKVQDAIEKVLLFGL